MSKRPGKAIDEEYQSYLDTSLEVGHASTCNDAELKAAVKLQLMEKGLELHHYLQNDLLTVFSNCLLAKQCGTKPLRTLAKAFEVLEMAAVNLYIFPWRQDLKTIKVFSGTFMHYLNNVLTGQDIAKFLLKLGYHKKDDHHFEVDQLPKPLQLSWVACGFFVARMECEILVDIMNKLDYHHFSIKDLIQERKDTESIKMHLERHKRENVHLKGRDASEDLIDITENSPGCCGQPWFSDGTKSSVFEPCSPSCLEYGSLGCCLSCNKPWSGHVNEKYTSKNIESSLPSVSSEKQSLSFNEEQSKKRTLKAPSPPRTPTPKFKIYSCYGYNVKLHLCDKCNETWLEHPEGQCPLDIVGNDNLASCVYRASCDSSSNESHQHGEHSALELSIPGDQQSLGGKDGINFAEHCPPRRYSEAEEGTDTDYV
nr:PREDICTED: spermatogenesis-associated protein 2-like protein isoform X2 [Latimeria chalumnae]|eukprot:XP_014345833.1 PREDICTED: spermatogenesis-associated protein 2-like protein isoform X2 [Latimeria chalumnae]